MEVLHFLLSTTPTGKEYADLIDFCVLRSKWCSLVAPSCETNTSREVLASLQPFLVRGAIVKEWPGTRTSGSPRELMLYRIEPGLLKFLKGIVLGLYDWRSSELPEDLAFYKGNGAVLLASVAHENIGHLFLTEDEKNAFINSVPGLALSSGRYAVPGLTPLNV
jgi:hypothetical protein